VRSVQVESTREVSIATWAYTVSFDLQIGVARNGGAKVGVCALLPLVLQVCAVDRLQTHVGHAASHDVEASGQCDDVVFAFLAVSSDDALLREFLDRSTVLGLWVDVHDADIVAVEDFVEVLLEARALDTEGVWRLLGEEDFVLSLVLHAG
jgi:hypothetical protein